MKILYLAAGWLSHEIAKTLRYAEPTATLDIFDYDKSLTIAEIVDSAKNFASVYDVALYFGVPEAAFKPSNSALSQLRDVAAKTVLLTPEGSDIAWRRAYTSHTAGKCFDLYVNFDGNDAWSAGGLELTLLTPFIPELYGTPILYDERPIACGFRGGINSVRTGYQALLPEVTWQSCGDYAESPYERYVAFVKNCRMMLNVRSYANPSDGNHVKGRVLEAGLAGCCLLEEVQSSAQKWFIPEEDYVPFRSVGDIHRFVANPPANAAEIGENLRRKILALHSPTQFWSAIWNRLAL